MKRKLMILGAAVLAAGILLCAIGFASVGFDLQKLNGNVEFTEKQFVVEADVVKAIKVAEANNTIELTRSADRNITITYYESEKDRYEIGVGTDGKLSMRYFDSRKWYEYIGVHWGRQDTHVTVALPADYRSDLDLTTVNGSVDIGDQMAGSLCAATTNGNILINQIGAAGEANLSTVNGQVSLSGLTADSLLARSTNGRIQVDGVSVVSSIDLSTTNGSISGTVAGSAQDYTVNAGTVNGSSNLVNAAGGAKTLSVHTTNGSIDIRFVP